MSASDSLCLLAFLALAVCFALAGNRLAVFTALAGIIGCAWGLLVIAFGLASEAPHTTLLGGAGLALAYTGLVLARVVIERSVSLHILRHEGREPAVGTRALIESRISELESLGLARAAGDRLRPTTAGRAIARAARLVQSVFRVAP